MNKNILVMAALLLSACSSAPSLREIQAQKPAVFKTDPTVLPSTCPEIPITPVDLAFDGFYSDGGKGGAWSVIDPDLFKQYLTVLAPFDKWTSRINSLADNYLRRGKVNDGRCAVLFLDTWARGDALLGTLKVMPNNPRQSIYQQKWLLAGAAAVYFKVMDLATPEEDARIKWWMSQVVKHVKQNLTDTQNHYTWAGATVMQVAILTDNRDDIEWARKSFNYTLNQIRRDGMLSTEVWRGRRALFYHNYTLHPLTYMAQLSRMIGEDWMNNEKLQNLMTFVNNSTLDKTRFEEIVGKVQDLDRPDEWGWYANLPDNDPRRKKIYEYMAVTKVEWISKRTAPFILKKLPDVKELGGDQQLFRDLVERKRRRTANLSRD